VTGSQLPTSFQVDAYQLSHSDIADSPIDTQYSSRLTRPVGFAVSSLPRHCGMRETDRLPASLASSTAESEPRPSLLTTISMRRTAQSRFDCGGGLRLVQHVERHPPEMVAGVDAAARNRRSVCWRPRARRTLKLDRRL
jgi:hypothetical protein